MRWLSAAMIGLAPLASVAAAVPFLETGGLLQRVPPNATLWEKRADIDAGHSCGDPNWRVFGERAYLAGIRLLGRTDDHSMRLEQAARDEIPDYHLGTDGMCTVLWCGGNHKKGRGVVFYLCLQAGTPNQLFATKDLAQKFHDGFYDCNGKREPQDDPDNTQLAFHVWAKGYDLHVEGGYDGMRCPGQMHQVAWPRPASLNYVPYTKKPKPA
jgi:hypothetical protein